MACKCTCKVVDSTDGAEMLQAAREPPGGARYRRRGLGAGTTDDVQLAVRGCQSATAALDGVFMRILWSISLGFIAVCCGCASTESVKESKEEGVHRVYQAPYATVYDATLAAAKAKKLELVESDNSTGRIEPPRVPWRLVGLS